MLQTRKKAPTVSSLGSQAIEENRALLTEFAGRYIWWMPPEEAILFPARVIAQVMNIGVFEDLLRLTRSFGDNALRQVIEGAEAGQFNGRSWHYWHYRLGMSSPGAVPPLPVKRIP